MNCSRIILLLSFTFVCWRGVYASPGELTEYDQEFPRRGTLGEVLEPMGWSAQDIHLMAEALSDELSVRRIRPGLRFRVEYTLGPVIVPTSIAFKVSATETVTAIRSERDHWSAHRVVEPVDIQLVSYSGFVESNLWDSALMAHMDNELISELSEIFAWQVDFSREVQKGDRWRLVVEKKSVKGLPAGWGRIVSAEFERGSQVIGAILFRKGDQDLGYFAPDGSSMRKMFLKSPIKFGRISSRFARSRFHPILQFKRPHLGVDYAAPTGTPVMAVGDGVVSFVGTKGGSGMTVQVRHNSVYQTAYRHLSAYAPGLRSGTHVRQGQTIGRVGSTGLATGPHLHFEFWENGRYVDPLGRKFPSAEPVARADRDLFEEQARRFMALLPLWFFPGVTAPGPLPVAMR